MYLAASMQWGLDFTINVMQTPFRAFVADLAAADQQFMMQMWFNVVCSVGTYLAFAIMGLYPVAEHHMLELMCIVLIVNVICVACALMIGKEKKFKRTGAAEKSACGMLAGAGSALKDLHMAFYILIFVLCLTWFGNTVWGSYGKVFFIDSVFEGNAEAPQNSTLYSAAEEGAKAFNKGGKLGSLASMALSFILMGVSFTSIPYHFIFAPLLFVGAIVCYMCAFVVNQSSVLAITSLVLSNIPLGAAGSIPYGIVAVWNKAGEASGKAPSVAMQMSILNCCITVGQELCHMVLGSFEKVNTVPKALNMLFTISMVANAVAAFAALFLGFGRNQVKSTEPSESEGETSESD